MPKEKPDSADRLRRLGQLVRSRRNELGIAQGKALAERMNVTPRVVTDIERGNRRAGENTYSKLENVLGWSPNSVKAVLDDDRDPIPAVARLHLDGEHEDLTLEAERHPDQTGEPLVDLVRDTRRQQRLETLFDRWVAQFVELIPIEIEYARLRGINDAREELLEVFVMAQQTKDGRPWTPPWQDWSDRFGDDAEPWRERWWQEHGRTGRASYKSPGQTIREQVEGKPEEAGRPDPSELREPSSHEVFTQEVDPAPSTPSSRGPQG